MLTYLIRTKSLLTQCRASLTTRIGLLVILQFVSYRVEFAGERKRCLEFAHRGSSKLLKSLSEA